MWDWRNATPAAYRNMSYTAFSFCGSIFRCCLSFYTNQGSGVILVVSIIHWKNPRAFRMRRIFITNGVWCGARATSRSYRYHCSNVPICATWSAPFFTRVVDHFVATRVSIVHIIRTPKVQDSKTLKGHNMSGFTWVILRR